MEKHDNIVEETLTFYEREKIFSEYGFLDSLLYLTPDEMKGVIGNKADGLYNSIQLVLNLMRMRSERISKSLQVTSSFEVYKCLKGAIIPETLYYEEFWVLYLSRNNQVISLEKISQGGYSGTVADLKMIIGKGLQLKASAMVACHNHPSGNTRPSNMDIQLTRKLRDACNLVDMSLTDHIIITDKTYFSFLDEGML